MPDPAGYSTAGDLLVGDTSFNSSDGQKFVLGAKDEIDSVLGFTYLIPLQGSATPHVTLLLKRISNLIASGRFLLAQATASEDTSLHAYGLSLLREGQDLLAQIGGGMIDLVGYDKLEVKVLEGNGPSILNADSASGVEAFHQWMNAGGELYGVPHTTWEPYA